MQGPAGGTDRNVSLAQAGFRGAAFLAGAFFAAGRAVLVAAALGFAVAFTAEADFGECGRTLPWLPA